jgi:transcriptional regulator with XRE-family HTH domain
MRTLHRVVGFNVRRVRKNKGIALDVLARRVKSTTAFVERVEKGQERDLTLDTLAALAKALKVDVIELVTRREMEDV